MKVIISSRDNKPTTIGAPPKTRVYWRGSVRIVPNAAAPVVQPIDSLDKLHPHEMEEWVQREVVKPLFDEFGEPPYFRVEIQSSVSRR